MSVVFPLQRKSDRGSAHGRDVQDCAAVCQARVAKYMQRSLGENHADPTSATFTTAAATTAKATTAAAAAAAATTTTTAHTTGHADFISGL